MSTTPFDYPALASAPAPAHRRPMPPAPSRRHWEHAAASLAGHMALPAPWILLAAFIGVWLCGFTLNFMTLLGLSLAIGVLIDDAIVVRENIVRHMEMGKDRRAAASEGTQEIGLAVAATTFSIVAVFIPVAFMPGVSGEWFRPFALTVATSVLVSLFISFTLDPMLSAYWGDPPGHHHAPKKGISLLLSRFNDWFDHQADRYGRVIAWALHHRKSMGAIAVVSLVGALVLHAYKGGSSFLPSADNGTIFVDIRTPPSSSLEYARLKVAKAAELAQTLPEAKATNATVNINGGRVYVDIGKSTQRKRSAQEVAVELRQRVSSLIGAEYVVQDDLNNGGGKPVQVTKLPLDVDNFRVSPTGDRIALSMAVFRDCADRGITLHMVNLGGGFPTKYLKNVPTVKSYGSAIFRALRRHFGNRIPETIIEPGRGMVGNAGVINADRGAFANKPASALVTLPPLATVYFLSE